uniref:DNA-directed RNA polymerase subunit n=1 Tax=Caulerpa lentillifera TaxID=148947 RepID=A0A345HGZ7_9CHLO|nr:RNA polymerase b1-subunit [Caulerpa lentillifera]AXG75887.1 RNA polymerase b1-subunit [Caulerpa lentillifera]
MWIKKSKKSTTIFKTLIMKFIAFRLRLATSQLIRKWAQHQLPNGQIISGQILNSKTVNYETFKPEKNGLFCERIFGPIGSKCACGLPFSREEKFCRNCEVEFTSPQVRRYRLGYIQLVTAVAHVWFFKGRPNYLSIFLNLPNKKIENLLYCTQNICRTIFPKEFENLISTNKKKSRKHFHKVVFGTPGDNRFWGWKKIPRYKYIWSLSESQSKCIFSPMTGMWAIEEKKNSTQFTGEKRRFLSLKKQFIGGIRDSALFFGFSIVSKMLSWNIHYNWFDFVYFACHFPKKGDLLNKYYPGPPGFVYFCPPQSRLHCFTGVQLIKTWLSQLTQNSRLLEIQLRIDLLKLDIKEPLLENEFVQKINLLRRFKYLRSFRHKKMNPASMILSVLPVLPPDLRPIIQLDGSKIAVSDLNKLYQYVILRNKRLSKLTRVSDFHCLNSEAFQYTQRLLQESVENLIENKSGGLKSLSDLFKGKKGRFRQNLLGKRVDYSGRSVIVVGPFLKIYECGIPKEIAYELFQPFLIRSLIGQKKAHTIFGAKKLLTSLLNHSHHQNVLWNFLKKIVEKHPLLLNRAPTLHRLSIQAFLPRLIDGRAILLHPLVCSPFNADFDGDQMGVHIPLCFQARGEAWKIMWSQNHLFSVATGNPVFSPSQDMILGSCFLTTNNIQQYCFSLLNTHSSKNSLDLLPGQELEQSNILKPIWISQNPFEITFETDKRKQKLIEIRINIYGQSQKLRSQFCQHFHPSGTEIFRHIRTTYGRLKFHQDVL